MNKYMLSVIIPTRNRQIYLLKTIEEIISVANDCVQIVIQDNSDSSELMHSEIIQSNKNIIYNYSAERLSFVDNFSKAIELAEGEYCCIIGDDDGVTAEINDVVEWAHKNSVEAVIPSVDFEYFYPKSIKWKNEDSDGIIRFLCEKCKLSSFVPENNLRTFLRNGCINYTYYDLVKLYHGIIRRDLLIRVKEITGNYIGGLTPDIYITVALSLLCKKAYRISYPVTIAGVCATSGSADSSNGKHVGRYEDAPHLVGHDDYLWSEQVPKFYSVETIWADSALAALRDMKRVDLLEEYNRELLENYCHYLYGNFESKYMNLNSTASLGSRMKYFPFSEYKRKVIRRMKRVGKKLCIIHGIKDIIQANEEFDKYRPNYLGDKSITEALNSFVLDREE